MKYFAVFIFLLTFIFVSENKNEILKNIHSNGTNLDIYMYFVYSDSHNYVPFESL